MTKKTALMLARALNGIMPELYIQQTPCYANCDKKYCTHIFDCVHLSAGNIEYEMVDSSKAHDLKAWLRWLMKVRETR